VNITSEMIRDLEKRASRLKKVIEEIKRKENQR